MTRLKLLLLWVLCATAAPILLGAMLLQLVAGSEARALSMAIGFDQTGNALLGGSEDETLSSRIGRHAVAGDIWALHLEKVVDCFFGKGHCRAARGT
jgi:hypothetical protein